MEREGFEVKLMISFRSLTRDSCFYGEGKQRSIIGEVEQHRNGISVEGIIFIEETINIGKREKIVYTSHSNPANSAQLGNKIKLLNLFKFFDITDNHKYLRAQTFVWFNVKAHQILNGMNFNLRNDGNRGNTGPFIQLTDEFNLKKAAQMRLSDGDQENHLARTHVHEGAKTD
ncbi:CLUMA_CG020761, isoform A [Clunio marinus]|uniref:CLUMA_CG020761, isoform A n=1 Tax=Clunio marinus TaxID=568069 RepID=A0A1J1J5Y6_9DIPT|nr:CLUMA_CG020761, isoform A [Clunio marinus]